MAGGIVNRTLLSTFYQNAGDVYDDNKTEGAYGVLADQTDANWNDLVAYKAMKGAAGGFASLDAGAKIPTNQLPDSIVGQLEYQSAWNAATNTPALPAPSTVKGHFYVTATAGTYLAITYGVGDWIVSNGTVWEKVDNTDAVASFNGRLGAILPASGDYDWSQINKANSSLADLTSRLASDLTGTLKLAQLADGSIGLIKLDLTSLDSRYFTEAETNALLLDNKNSNHAGTWQGLTPSGIGSESINGSRLDVIEPKLSTLPPAVLNLGYGLQVLNVTKATPYNVLNIVGRTLINLHGKVGGCTNASDANLTYLNCTGSLDTVSFVGGTSSIKLTASGTNTAQLSINIPQTYASKYYVGVVDINAGTQTSNIVIQMGEIGLTNQLSFSSSYTGYKTVHRKYHNNVDITNDKFLIAMLTPSTGKYINIDNARVYEISAAEYANMDAMTPEQVAAKYPYVDDVKHVDGTYINRIGENMLPPFYEWTLHAKATVESPYVLKLTADANFQTSGVSVPCLPNTTYTISSSNNTSNTLTIVKKKDTNGSTYGTLNIVTKTLTFTTDASTTALWVEMTNDAVGAFTFVFPRLNIGAVDKGFKPRNDDSLIFPNVPLASNPDGSVYDQLFRQDGKWFRENRFARDMVLDGSLAWAYRTDNAGNKEFILPSSNMANINTNNVNIVKYDGKITNRNSSSASPIGIDNFYLDVNNLVIGISDTDTGWFDAWVAADLPLDWLKAYFNGWKYTGTTDKVTLTWVNVNGGAAAPTQTLAYVSTTKAPNYTPYKLTYQLTTPTFEEIAYEGSLSLIEGNNQFEVGNGTIVREKINPFYYSLGNAYLINNQVSQSCLFKYRADKLIGLYKNGVLTKTYSIDFLDSNRYGNFSMAIPFANFDPSATYEVTYLALDQYTLTTNVQTINGEYDSNIKMVVDRLSQNQADIDARLSIVENNKARKVQGQWITPTMLNGWIAAGGLQYMKDEMGFVHIRGRMTSGANAVPAFVLPSGYKPLTDLNYNTIQNTAGAWGAGAIDILSTGEFKVSAINSGNTNVIFGEIIFLAA